MTLPTSGPLTFANIQTEFGGTNPIGLNEYYAGGSYVASGTTGTYGAVPSSGQIGVQNFYGTSAFIPTYIEQVFSTYLYTGTGSSLPINNGLDLSTKGGLVWLKQIDGGNQHILEDSARGVSGSNIVANSASNAQPGNDTNGTDNVITSLNTTGFTLGTGSNFAASNVASSLYVSWAFRKQPKFFDVVTYTGNGTSGRTVAHSLGSVPGCIIVKKYNSTGNWAVYHRGLNGGSTPEQWYMILNSTGVQNASASYWNNTAPTSTQFTVGSFNDVNTSGATYVAYIFAHNAGGFGLSNTDNVISCGNFTTDGSGVATINLGYEPQWVLYRKVNTASNWYMVDTMRGLSAWTYSASSNKSSALLANSTAAQAVTNNEGVYSQGFGISGAVSEDYIYIAIRRGPMKVPTDATKVFAPQVYSSGSSPAFGGLSFPPDMAIQLYKVGGNAAEGQVFGSKLQGTVKLKASSTAAEASEPDFIYYQNGFRAGSLNANYAAEMFRRAPSFFDEVCYTGVANGSTPPLTLNHNLGVKPELMIVKARTNVGPLPSSVWLVYTGNKDYYMVLNTTAANVSGYPSPWVNEPTATQFTVGVYGDVNDVNNNYVAYLFATCAGVSKVGSYTGTGATQTISCGFTGGARFVLVKRTDTTGDWYIWDTARGMVSGTDPSLLLNSTAAEVNANSIYTATGGFQIVSTAAGINASGGSYIYFSVA